ncbi:VCBS repeat-containing protein [bacterium]|nr:VCBS repeat-containing protein [bacterium]
MNHGSYNDPVRYVPPSAPAEPRRNPRFWLIGCGSCAVLIVITVVLLVHTLRRSFEELAPDVPEAGVQTGTQPAWRRLDYWPGNLFIVTEYMRVLDSNGDGEQELLFYNSMDGTVELTDLDGKVLSSHQWDENLDNEHIEFWDCDGDGRDDVVVFEWADAGPLTRCLDLDFNELQRWPDWCLSGQRSTADFNGDGRDELLLVSQDGDRFAVYGPGPQRLELRDNPATAQGHFPCPPLWADMDADGRSSVLYGQGQNRMLLDSGGRRGSFGIRPHALLEYGYDFNLAIDISGDGISDLLNQDNEYYNAATGEVIVLQNPVSGAYRDYTGRRAAVSFDLDSDGEAELCMVPDNEDGSEFLSFAADGSLEYHESLGTLCAGLEVVRRGGREHLVLCAFDRVLVYP